MSNEGHTAAIANPTFFWDTLYVMSLARHLNFKTLWYFQECQWSHRTPSMIKLTKYRQLSEKIVGQPVFEVKQELGMLVPGLVTVESCCSSYMELYQL